MDIGLIFADMINFTTEDIFTYEDDEKTILTGISDTYKKRIDMDSVVKYDIYVDGEKITDLIIPDRVKIIGNNAFINCISIKNIKLGSNVEKIGVSAFENCNFLKFITIPDTMISIGNFAFINCKSLQTIDITENIIDIGNSAFENCSSLKKVNIPKSVTSIGTSAFAYCEALEEFVVDENSSKYVSENGVLFDKNVSTLIQYPLAKIDKSYNIPESVINIEGFAFLLIVNI